MLPLPNTEKGKEVIEQVKALVWDDGARHTDLRPCMASATPVRSGWR